MADSTSVLKLRDSPCRPGRTHLVHCSLQPDQIDFDYPAQFTKKNLKLASGIAPVRALLDDEQRARYDRDSRPPGVPPGAGGRR